MGKGLACSLGSVCSFPKSGVLCGQEGQQARHIAGLFIHTNTRPKIVSTVFLHLELRMAFMDVPTEGGVTGNSGSGLENELETVKRG